MYYYVKVYNNLRAEIVQICISNLRHSLSILQFPTKIMGGESGPGARPLMQEWVTDVRDQCLRAKVPFFFKQWGGVQKKRAGRTLEGRTWDEMPRNLNVA